MTSSSGYFSQQFLHKSNHYTSSIRPVLSLRVGVPLRARPLLTLLQGKRRSVIILYFASTIPEHGAVRSKEDEVTHTDPTFIHNSHPLIPANKNSLRAAGGPAQILTTANLKWRPTKQKQPVGRRRPCPNFHRPHFPWTNFKTKSTSQAQMTPKNCFKHKKP